MTNISQQQLISILKAIILSADKGSLSCVMIGQNLISLFFVFSLSLQKLALHFVIL